MSEQSNQTEQSSMTSLELRQRMLEELDASKQAIAELSDEELEEAAGGAGWSSFAKGAFHDKTLQAIFAGGAVSGIVMGVNKALGHKGGGG